MFFDNLSKIRLASTVMVSLPALCRIYAGILIVPIKRMYPETDYVFISERKAPLTASTIRKITTRAGDNTNIGMSVHPHMLRHATGYKLANEGHDTRSIQQYLGHKNIKHTTRYTDISTDKFKKFWKD